MKLMQIRFHINKSLFLFVCVAIAQFAIISTMAAYKKINKNIKIRNPTNASKARDSRIWPPMKHHDIWNTELNYGNEASDTEVRPLKENGLELFEDVYNDKTSFNNYNETTNINMDDTTSRQSRVIHIFPVPVDGECLSDDGRRTGVCFNAYECRLKGGAARGDCAMGFGVCCIFIANCNESVTNNITYLVSPNFPSYMANNYSTCNINVKIMSEDISQLRIDFYHFSLGQPNRKTGICDGDIFNISGGPSGTFSLCGQNSGQHIYYDVAGRAAPRQTLYGSLRPLTYEHLYPTTTNATNGEQIIVINMNFTQRFLPIRLWEIRVAQIPFSQRAPAGCLQFHTGAEGIMQTFNFAENGRHLANQQYRICVRQETEMCSINYQPCDEQSFRIGSSAPSRTLVNSQQQINTMPGNVVGEENSEVSAILNDSAQGGNISTATANGTNIMQMMMTMLSTTTLRSITNATMATTTEITTPTIQTANTTMAMIISNTTAANMSPETTNSANTTSMGSFPMSTTVSSITNTDMVSSTSPLSDDVEGSGGGDNDVQVTPANNVSRRPRPVSGGFDLLGFLRSAFDLGFSRQARRFGIYRQERQFFSSCNDRITMPCIIEDFIGTGLGPLPSCEPVHCGSQFCSSGIWPCRIESTVTPFYIGVHFGDGIGKGSAEDNIGMCLRYSQVPCV